MNEPFGNNKIEAADLNRGNDRDSLFLKATIKFPSSGEGGEVRIRNLSAGGLMAETSTRAVRGEKVEINLRTVGWIGGVVAWVAEGRIGIAFEHPIDPRAVRKPVGQNNEAIAPYLQKITKQQQSSLDKHKLRRI